jgi:glutaredoxin
MWCEAAKNLLDRKKYEYIYIDLIDLPIGTRQDILSESGMRTVPIIKIDNIYIGGFDALEGYINGKELGV